jgi:enoyl-CoA hydratase
MPRDSLKETAMTDHVTLAIDDGVAEILLNRPEKLNAVTPDMAAALADCCAEVDRNDGIRAVLLRGAGTRAFCAGSDLNSLAEYPTAWKFRNRVGYEAAVRNIRKPVVAAMFGWVLGGGLEMALAADIRVCGEGARCGFPEVKRGWVGAGGASQLLPRLIGYGQAMRLLLTGEPVDAAEAHRLGLVEFLVPDAEVEARARAIARQLAALSPVAVQAVKASVRMALAAPLDAGLRYENEMNTLCFAAGDHLEGIRAFQEGRTPAFER